MYSNIKLMELKMEETAMNMLKNIKESETSEKMDKSLDKKKNQLLSLNNTLNSIKKEEMVNPIMIKVPDVGTQRTVENYIETLENKQFSVMSINSEVLKERDL